MSNLSDIVDAVNNLAAQLASGSAYNGPSPATAAATSTTAAPAPARGSGPPPPIPPHRNQIVPSHSQHLQQIYLQRILVTATSRIPVVSTAASQASYTSQILGSAGFSAFAAASPVAAFAGASALVVGSLAAVGGALVAFGKSISNANRAISGYSPTMTFGYALGDVAEVFRNFASAQRRSVSETTFGASFSSFQNAIRPSMDSMARIVQSLGSIVLRIATPIARLAEGPLNWLADKTENAADLNKLAGGAILRALRGESAWDITKGIFHDIANNKPDSHNAILQAQSALQEAISALRENTAALRAQGGSGGVLASDFMVGMAHGPAFRVKQRMAPASRVHGGFGNAPSARPGMNAPVHAAQVRAPQPVHAKPFHRIENKANLGAPKGQSDEDAAAAAAEATTE